MVGMSKKRCKVKKAAYDKEYNRKNRERILRRKKDYYQRSRGVLLRRYRKKWQQVLGDVMQEMGGKCVCCGLEFDGYNFYAFDRHHVNPKTKSFHINASMASKKSYAELLEEAEKCILLCALCHRELHYYTCDNISLHHETVNELIC